MLRRSLRRRPSPALVISIIALVFAAGGTTYALTLPFGSVGPAQLRTGAVLNSKLPLRQVTNSKLAVSANNSTTVRDGTLGGVDIKDDDLTGRDINEDTLANNYVAYVQANGTVGFASPGVTLAGHVAGITVLHFPTPVSGKPIVVSLANGGPGEISAAPCGGQAPAGVTCAGALNTTANVTVFQYNSSGVPNDHAFYIVIPKGNK